MIDGSGYAILAEYDTPDWSPDKAQDWVAGQITQYGDDIVGGLCGQRRHGQRRDRGAQGGERRPAARSSPGRMPSSPRIQRILAGDQYMTVYKAIKPQAELAAEVAVALLTRRGARRPTPMIDGTPATLLDAVVVTVDNILETVVADGF